MSKFVASFTPLVFLALLFAPFSFAQKFSASTATDIGRPIMPLPPSENQGFWGQDHSYSVVFRGNGEAVVRLWGVVFDEKTGTLTQVNLRVPEEGTNKHDVF